LYNLKSGSEIEVNTLFKTDVKTQHKLDSVILHKLDFVPEDMGAVRYERQFYFEKNKLMVFYDTYTIGRKETYSFELSYKEVQDLLNPAGPLALFFIEKKTVSK